MQETRLLLIGAGTTAVTRMTTVFVRLLILVFIWGFTAPAGFCDPGSQLALPQSSPSPRAVSPIGEEQDILLVMPSASAEKDDVSDALKEAHGEIVGTIGEGALQVLKIRCQKGEMLEAEKKLTADKHFDVVQRNYLFKVNAVANDPYFASEWHLSALNVMRAWDVSFGGANILGVLDTGCNGSIADLSGKTYSGYDAINKQAGQTDVYGHGSMVATTAAANTNNSVNTAAPARLAYIYPIRVGDANGSISESAVIEGIYQCGQLGIKMINLSANAPPPYTFANKKVHPVFHTYAKWFHDQMGGLIFNSAGNDARKDINKLVPYLIVVSAISTNYRLASFSNYGNPIWFTGPGVGIYCSDRAGNVVSVSGTSFSSPLCASIASLIWGANPGLKNTDIERILQQTAYKGNGGYWNIYYGYGMPNAEAAVKAATGR